MSRALLPDSVSYGKQNFIYLKTAKKLLIYTIVAVCMDNKLYLFRKRIVRVIRGKKIVSFLFCLLLFSGCGPEADGGNEVPDTENAKAVFYNRFGFAPPDTVKGIYYYNDLFLYITDPAYYLVCKAPPEVVEKIVKKLNLIKMNDLSAPSLISSVYWWDEELQKRSQGYFKEDEQKRCYYYLFYHEETKTLQYCEFYT